MRDSFQYKIDDSGWAPVGGAPSSTSNSTGLSNGTITSNTTGVGFGAANATSLGVMIVEGPPLITSNATAVFVFDVVAFGSTNRSTASSLMLGGVLVETRVDSGAVWGASRPGEPLVVTGLKDGLHLLEARARWGAVVAVNEEWLLPCNLLACVGKVEVD